MSEQKSEEEIVEQLEKGMAEVCKRLGLEVHTMLVRRSQVNLVGYRTFSINSLVTDDDDSSS